MGGFRQTKQREAILEFLMNVKSHPTADTIFQNVKKGLPTMTLATVYRNLNVLNTMGQVARLEVNGEFRFDADIKEHQHFVCKRCNCIIDLSVLDSKNMINKVNSFDGFRAETMDIMFRGVCRDCRR